MVRRWSRLSNIEKFDAYTRWSLYALIAAMPAILLSWIHQQRLDRGFLREAFWLASIAYAAACLVVAWQSIGRRRTHKQSARIAAYATVLTTGLATVALAVATWPPPTPDALGRRWVVVTCVGFAIATTTLRLPVRHVVLITGISVAAVVLIVGRGAFIQTVISTSFCFASALLAIRASVAMLELMYRIDNGRAVEAQLAVAEERLRISRDLHDTLGHHLSAIALKSQVARAQVSRDAASAEREIDAVRMIADESLMQMRAVVRGYRAVDLATEISGARGLLTSAGIECIVVGTADADDLAWVVREGVTNVIRHSNARHCRIDVAEANGVASVRIWNDGAGAACGSGSGIRGLTARLVAVGGTVHARRPRSDEFELFAQIPSPSPRRSGDNARLIGDTALDVVDGDRHRQTRRAADEARTDTATAGKS